MRKPKVGILIVVGIVVVISFLTSCTKASTPESKTSSPGGTEGTTVGATNQEESQVESGSQTATSGESITNIDRVPEDIPIMPGGRKLEVTQDGSNISYEIDGKIEDVVAFYQEELPKYGWEMTRSPDNAVGSMATMARENEAGDRLTFSLQYNPMGEFVVVRIVELKLP